MVQTSDSTGGALFAGGTRFTPLGPLLAAVEAWASAERSRWPLWAPLALGAGISAYFTLPTPQHWATVAVLGLGLALLCRGWGSAGRFVSWGGLWIAIGLCLAWGRAETVSGPVIAETTKARQLTAFVESREGLGDGRTRLILRPISIEGVTPREYPRLVRLTARGAVGDDIASGAQIHVRALLSPPPGPAIPGGYDFARRAWFEGIGAVAVPLGTIIIQKPPPEPQGIMARIEAVRHQLTERLRARIPGEAGGVAAALVTGDRAGLSPELMEAVRASGLAHLLSISGLHIALVAGGAFWLVRRLLCLSPWLALHWPVKATAAVAAALAAIGYTLLSGAGLPTVRSCIATLVVLVGILIGRQAISLRLVAVGALLILLVRPEAWLNPSFQLSFAAVTGLVALYQSPFAERWLRGREEHWTRRGLRWAASLAISGLVAEAMLSPIVIAHFNQTGVYGALANLVAIPLVSFWIMPLLVLAVLAEPFGGIPWLAEGLTLGLQLLIDIAYAVASWDGAVVRWPMLPNGAFALIMLGLFWICLWQRRVRLLGLVAVAGGLGMAAASPKPDLLISGDGKLVAVRMQDDTIGFNSLRAARFARSTWLEGNGLPEDAATSLAGSVKESGMLASCDAGLCRMRLERGGRSWAVSWVGDWLKPEAMTRLCRESDIVVASRGLPGWCQPALLRLDARLLRQTGAVTLRLKGDGELALQSTQMTRGRHPWVTAAEARQTTDGPRGPKVQ